MQRAKAQHRAEDPSLIGCCGWSEGREKYFSHFPIIELQTTFYEPPSVALAAKWRAAAPENFQFCLKAWQLITHSYTSPTYRRLKSPLSPEEHDLVGSFQPTEQVWLGWERTAEVARILRARVVLFQCPASLLPSRENIRHFEEFFSRVGVQGFELAWEPRGDWPLPLVSELCTAFHLTHCIDPFQIAPGQTHSTYWRLHGRGGYSYRYSDEELVSLRDMILKTPGDAHRPVRVLFNNVWMKDDALRFQQLWAAASS